MKQIDCRNWPCPKPVIEVRKALLAAPDEPLCALVEDPIARQNLQRLATTLACTVQESRSDGSDALIFIPSTVVGATTSISGASVVLIAAETMGSGNDDLGRILLRNFLISLAELEIPPDAIFFINGGVKLVVRDAETVEILEKLTDSGIDIASCGLCLEFFNLKDQLAVGRITNMLDIVQSMANAGRVLRP